MRNIGNIGILATCLTNIHCLAGAANACRYGEINEDDVMPLAYDHGMQNFLDADDFPARIRTFV